MPLDETPPVVEPTAEEKAAAEAAALAAAEAKSVEKLEKTLEKVRLEVKEKEEALKALRAEQKKKAQAELSAEEQLAAIRAEREVEKTERETEKLEKSIRDKVDELMDTLKDSGFVVDRKVFAKQAVKLGRIAGRDGYEDEVAEVFESLKKPAEKKAAPIQKPSLDQEEKPTAKRARPTLDVLYDKK